MTATKIRYYSAAPRRTRAQERFTISEVTADWHELMTPQRIWSQPLPGLANNWTRTAPISYTRPSPRSP